MVWRGERGGGGEELECWLTCALFSDICASLVVDVDVETLVDVAEDP